MNVDKSQPLWVDFGRIESNRSEIWKILPGNRSLAYFARGFVNVPQNRDLFHITEISVGDDVFQDLGVKQCETLGHDEPLRFDRKWTIPSPSSRGGRPASGSLAWPFHT